jgi:hypothetical protein
MPRPKTRPVRAGAVRVRPIVEEVARKMHPDWLRDKRRLKVTSHPSPWGEDLLVPWERLSERAKNQNRRMVRRTIKTLAELT